MSLMSLRGASSRMLRTCSRVSAWRIRSRRTCVVGWETWKAVPRKQPLPDQPGSREGRGPGAWLEEVWVLLAIGGADSMKLSCS